MKKTLITFMFLLISMALFFLPEVYGINYYDNFNTEMNALKGAKGESVRVTLGVHDETDSSGNQIYHIQETEHRENGNNTKDGTQVYFFEVPGKELNATTVSGGIPLVIFVGTRDANIDDKDTVNMSVLGDYSNWFEYGKDATDKGDNKAGAYYAVYPKQEGRNVIKLYFECSAKIYFEVEIVVTIKASSAPPSSAGGVGDQTQGKDDSTEEGDEDSINADNVNVIISQADIQYWSREYKNMNGNGKESEAPVINITLYNSFAATKDIKIYIASEERGLSGECFVDVTENGNTIDKLEGSEWENDTTGCNCFISNTYIRLDKGFHTIRFHVYNPDESEGLNFYININFGVADYASGAEMLLNQFRYKIDEVHQDDVMVAIEQTSHRTGFHYLSDPLHIYKNANNTGGSIGHIKIEDFIFGNSESIEVLIATEEPGLSGQCSITIQEGHRTITPVGDESGWYIEGQGIGFDINALVSYNKLLNLGVGWHTLTFFVKSEDGEGINFSFSIEFEVGEEALDLGPILDIDEENAISQNELKSGQVKVKVASTTTRNRFARIYKDMKDYREKDIDVDIVNVGTQSVLDIYIYYERIGLSNGVDDHSFTLPSGFPSGTRQIKDGGPIGENFTEGNNSYYGNVRLIIEKNVRTLTIPIQMKTKQSSGNYNTFDINIRINVNDPGDDDSREHGTFNDVLTQTDYYTPTGGSSEGIDELENKVSIVLTVVTNMGIVLCVLVSAILGIKYMLASVEEKAEIKQDLVPYVIGVSLLFGICVFVKILQAVGSGFNT